VTDPLQDGDVESIPRAVDLLAIEAEKALNIIAGRRMSATQYRVMTFAIKGTSLWSGCCGLSEHGGRQTTIDSLLRRNWISRYSNAPTAKGLEAVEAYKESKGL
jgi:hypothetical protein